MWRRGYHTSNEILVGREPGLKRRGATTEMKNRAHTNHVTVKSLFRPLLINSSTSSQNMYRM